MPKELAVHYYEGYLVGVATRLECPPIKTNPYKKGTEQAMAWNLGYADGLAG